MLKVSVLETGHTRYCSTSGSDPLRQSYRLCHGYCRKTPTTTSCITSCKLIGIDPIFRYPETIQKSKCLFGKKFDLYKIQNCSTTRIETQLPPQSPPHADKLQLTVIIIFFTPCIIQFDMALSLSHNIHPR